MKAFPGIYVIALERETERRRKIDKNLKELGLTYRFIDASTPPDNEEEARKTGYERDRARKSIRRELSMVEVACFMSHKRAWREVLETGAPGLVLESDAQLYGDTVGVLLELMGGADVGWEMVMLDYNRCVPALRQRRRIYKEFQLVRFASGPVFCAAAYMVTPRAAEKLLNNSGSIFLPVDNYMTGGYVDKGIDLYAVYPRCVGRSIHARDSSTMPERERLIRERKRRRSVQRGVIRAILRKVRHRRKDLTRFLAERFRQVFCVRRSL